MQLPWQTIYNLVSTDNSKLLSSIILHLWKEILSLPIFTSVCYSWTTQIFPSLKTEKSYLFVTLICIFPNSRETEHFFMCSLAIILSLEKCLFQCCVHFLSCLYCWLLRVLYIFQMKVPYEIYDLKIVSPFCQSSFYFPNGILSGLSFSFWWSSFYLSGSISKKPLPHPGQPVNF